jgi:hypothetical protein
MNACAPVCCGTHAGFRRAFASRYPGVSNASA